MERIFFNNEIVYYKVQYIPLTNKDILINHINKLIELQEETAINDGYDINIDDDLIIDIIEFGIDKCKELYLENGNNVETILHDLWLNRVRKYSEQLQATTLKNPIFHNHKTLNEQRNIFIPDYTFVYYLQMQNNLTGNEGHLMIKNKSGEIYSFLPEENDLIIMGGDVPHSPVPAANNTKDRLVIAGNVSFKYHKKKII